MNEIDNECPPNGTVGSRRADLSESPGDDASTRERLSALVDGELSSPLAIAAACTAWKEDAEMRAAWHAYQLIGDVLRSDDLASAPARDSVFMQSLRARLGAEPVVLAPALLPTSSGKTNDIPGSRRRWAMPAAMAAAVMVAAGALLVAQGPAQKAAADRWLAEAPSRTPVALAGPTASGRTSSPTQATVALSNPAATSPVGDMPAIPVVIRDAQLDRYLVAHRQFAGSTALGMPSGFLRNASLEVPGR